MGQQIKVYLTYSKNLRDFELLHQNTCSDRPPNTYCFDNIPLYIARTNTNSASINNF